MGVDLRQFKAAVVLLFWIPTCAVVGGEQPQQVNSADPASSSGPAIPCSALPEAAASTAETIVAKLVEANARRAAQLAGYTATRSYRAENPRWKKSATMEVKVVFTSPASKVFTVVEERGSGTIRQRVFRRMLEAEKDALTPEMRRRSDIGPANYRFRFLDEDTLDGQRVYVLELEPLRADRYSLRGRIWVDACDFAIAKIRGSPAKSPSFWTRKVEYERVYHKVGEFWLLQREAATSETFIFGKSNVGVEHSSYEVERIASPSR